MRIRVTDVLELLGAGASFEEILQGYPYLEREDILASLQYAARQTDHSVLLSAWNSLRDATDADVDLDAG
jgi:uncharacterized protein (DUF433 family)